jgi:CBS domain-containing protein
MNEFPLPHILKFLQKVVPFNTLDRAVIEQIVADTQIAFYPKDDIIIEPGERPNGFLYIVQTGCARITIPDDAGVELLVDLRGEGEIFGAISLLHGQKALFKVMADEDLIVFLIPKEVVENLLVEFDDFKRYFGSSLARNFQAVRKSADHQLTLFTRDNQLNIDRFLTGKRVLELMTSDVMTCPPSFTVQQAAQKMKQRRVGSIIVTGGNNAPVGIITDADLRSKVLAEGLSLQTPAHRIMSTPVHTISPWAYTFDALLDMSRFHISHMVVSEKQKIVGIISEHDFQLEIGSSPIGMIGDIDKSDSVETLINLRPNIDRILEMAIRRSGAVKPMVALIAELNDRITRQIIKVIEKEMVTEGAGAPPAPYCWLAMGSEGRSEQTLYTDQDNALLYADVPEADDPQVKKWFLLFSRRVVDALDRYGIPKCSGGMMASNPQWCQNLSSWERLFSNWISEPTPWSLRMATVFFDFRSITHEFDGAGHLRQMLTHTARKKKHFLRLLAQNALFNHPPLGFLRQLVVEKSGEHKNKLNLKLSGLAPVVDAARVLALELGIETTNTMERLEKITDRKILEPDFLSAIDNAYDFINFIRITHHLKALSRGSRMQNFIDPVSLNPMQRKMLKESFAIISRLQEQLGARYQARFSREG